MEKTTLHGVRSIEFELSDAESSSLVTIESQSDLSLQYDGNTLTVEFEDGAQSLEGVESPESPEEVPEGPCFEEGDQVYDDRVRVEFDIHNVSDKTAGEYFIEDKGMTVAAYNGCSGDQTVYEGQYRGRGKTYAVPECRLIR